MKILVISTRTGDVYYSADSESAVSRAVEFAAWTVMSEGYGRPSKDYTVAWGSTVKRLIEEQDFVGLDRYLRAAGVIREAEVIE